MKAGVAPVVAFLVFKQIHSSVISASPKIAWLQWISSANHSNQQNIQKTFELYHLRVI